MMEVVEKIPYGSEITTYEIANEVACMNLDFHFLMKLDRRFKNDLVKRGYIIDTSIHNDEVLGMPYHIGFILKGKKHE